MLLPALFSLCWWRMADPGGTPSRSSCSARGGPAPPPTGRRALCPRSPQPWLELHLQLVRWPPPPLLCCAMTLRRIIVRVLKQVHSSCWYQSVLTLEGHAGVPQVVWVGHAVCDDSALKGNHWFVFCQRLWYRWMNSEEAVWGERFTNHPTHHHCYTLSCVCNIFFRDFKDKFTIFAPCALIRCESSSQDECRGALQHSPHSAQILRETLETLEWERKSESADPHWWGWVDQLSFTVTAWWCQSPLQYYTYLHKYQNMSGQFLCLRCADDR